MKIKISLKLLSPLLIGSSEDIYGFAKSQLEHDNVALISGSELKGNFRHIFKSIPSLNQFEDSLFGNTLRSGKLFFETLELTNPNYIERVGISINRDLNVVENQKLFMVKALNSSENPIFEGYINVNGTLSESEKRSLIFAANIIDKIGSMKSRGFGKVKITLDFVDIAEPKDSKDLNDGIYEMIFKVKSPIILTSEMAKAYLYTSRTFVSGETLRGAYAEFFDKRSDVFKHIFNQGKVHFPFLYPSLYNRILIPSPQTWFTLKHSNGDMIYDILLGKYVEKIFEEKGFKAVLTDKVIKDGKEVRIGPFRGYFDLDSQVPVKIPSRNFFSTQIEIDPFTKTAKSGILRSYDAFYPNYLGGYLKVDYQNKALINELLKHTEIQIGNSKTRGFGHLELFSIRKIESNSINLLKIANEKFRKVINQINELNNTKEFDLKKTLVPIVLTSDLIERDFENLLGQDFKLKLSFTRRQNISGYNAYSKSNKTLYNSVVSGSVFLFECDKDVNEVAEILDKKRNEGLGYLTESGFGDFSIYVPLEEVKRREER